MIDKKEDKRPNPITFEEKFKSWFFGISIFFSVLSFFYTYETSYGPLSERIFAGLIGALFAAIIIGIIWWLFLYIFIRNDYRIIIIQTVLFLAAIAWIYFNYQNYPFFLNNWLEYIRQTEGKIWGFFNLIAYINAVFLYFIIGFYPWVYFKSLSEKGSSNTD